MDNGSSLLDEICDDRKYEKDVMNITIGQQTGLNQPQPKIIK